MKIILFLLIIFSLHLAFLNQLTFTAWPEMLSYPYLWSHGFTPYKDFVIPYPPLLIFVLVLVFKLFGYSPVVLSVFTKALILAEDLLVFSLIKRIIQRNFVSLLIVIFFIITQSVLDGNQLWFDFATTLPMLLAYYFLLANLEEPKSKSIILLGIFLGLAVLIKQTALAYFLIVIIFFGLLNFKNILKISFYLFLGLIIPLIPLAVFLIFSSSLKDFYLWNFYYPLAFWSKFPGYVLVDLTRREKLTLVFLILPLLLVLLKPSILRCKGIILTLVFLLGSAVSIYPRFSYFHLQTFIAFSFILSVLILSKVSENKFLVLALGILLIALSSTFIFKLNYQYSLGSNVRFFDQSDQKLASETRSLVPVNQKVFLIGINSSEYALADRLPPKNWSDNFGWYLEIPGVQEKVIEGLKSQPPLYILRRTPDNGLWYQLGSYQPKKIIDYIYNHYQFIGKIDSDIQIWKRKD